MGALSETTAVVLAGGLGTRLRQVVGDRPKGLAQIAGRPFLMFLLDQLDAAGVQSAVICTGYLGSQMQETLGRQYGNLRLTYSQEPSPLGTGGAVRLALPLLTSDPVLVLNGDSYCQADLPALADWHRRHRAEATVLLTRVPNVARYGRVTVDEHNAVVAFEEKGAAVGPGAINAGIYLLSRRFMESIPAAGPASLEREVFPAWIGRGLFGCPAGGRFLDIGTPESYAAAEEFFEKCTVAGTLRVPSASSRARTMPATTEKADGTRSVPATIATPRPFVIFDRDGTLIVERHYLSNPDQVELLPGVAEGLRRLRDLGLGLLVATNQSALGRGFFDRDRLDQIHRRMEELLAAEGVRLDGVYVCPHTPDDDCPCRKPRPGLVEQAARELGFDPKQCFVVGDKECDIELGRRTGATTLLVRTGYGAELAQAGTCPSDYVVADAAEAARIIERLLPAGNAGKLQGASV
jgi:histidinol-phosphate phosphatase family protein